MANLVEALSPVLDPQDWSVFHTLSMVTWLLELAGRVNLSGLDPRPTVGLQLSHRTPLPKNTTSAVWIRIDKSMNRL
jgi:hypothetical protein